MKKAIATTTLYTSVECPHCNQDQDFDPAEYGLDEGEQFGATDVNMQIQCIHCDKDFIVTDIEF